MPLPLCRACVETFAKKSSLDWWTVGARHHTEISTAVLVHCAFAGSAPFSNFHGLSQLLQVVVTFSRVLAVKRADDIVWSSGSLCVTMRHLKKSGFTGRGVQPRVTLCLAKHRTLNGEIMLFDEKCNPLRNPVCDHSVIIEYIGQNN